MSSADKFIEMGSPKGEAANKKLSKAEKAEKRKKENYEWRTINKSMWSDKDANPRHSLYYKAQLKDLSEEWLSFQTYLNKELPMTFRLTEFCNPIIAHGLERRLRADLNSVSGKYVEIDGKPITGGSIVLPVPWLQHAWQCVGTSAKISQQEGLQAVSRALHRESDLGNIVRQELVSMIPAYVLDVKEDSVALDMCAAPGSKTEQIISLMRKDWAEKKSKSSEEMPDKYGYCPSGVLVANDSDPKRINTLRNRLSNNAAPFVVFTCSRAEEIVKYMNPATTATATATAADTMNKKHKKGDDSSAQLQEQLEQQQPRQVLFDRILADVPCSGDGTFRKCPHLWRLFRPRIALDFHLIQLKIALAGVSLLKEGGRFVYSTCSLNPIEDEAVVASMLEANAGCLELVDVKEEGLLPLLRFREGLHEWLCNEDILSIGEESAEATKESKARLPRPLPASVFPPSKERATEMHLERCMRLFPHDQDTGGFFVAVFVKKQSKVSKLAAREGKEKQAAAMAAAAKAAAAGSAGTVIRKSNKRGGSASIDPDIDEHHWYQDYSRHGSYSAFGPGAPDGSIFPTTTVAMAGAAEPPNMAKTRSLNAMRSLGYNPKNSRTVSSSSSSGAGGLAASLNNSARGDSIDSTHIERLRAQVEQLLFADSALQLSVPPLRGLTAVPHEWDRTLLTLGLDKDRILNSSSNTSSNTSSTSDKYKCSLLVEHSPLWIHNELLGGIGGSAAESSGKAGNKRRAAVIAAPDGSIIQNEDDGGESNSSKKRKKKKHGGGLGEAEDPLMFGSKAQGWKMGARSASYSSSEAAAAAASASAVGGEAAAGATGGADSTAHKLVLISNRALRWVTMQHRIFASFPNDVTGMKVVQAGAVVATAPYISPGSAAAADEAVLAHKTAIIEGDCTDESAKNVKVSSSSLLPLPHRWDVVPLAVKTVLPVLDSGGVIELSLADFIYISKLGSDDASRSFFASATVASTASSLSEEEGGRGDPLMSTCCRVLTSCSEVQRKRHGKEAAANGVRNIKYIVLKLSMQSLELRASFAAASSSSSSSSSSASLGSVTALSSIIGGPVEDHNEKRRLSVAEKKKLKKLKSQGGGGAPAAAAENTKSAKDVHTVSTTTTTTTNTNTAEFKVGMEYAGGLEILLQMTPPPMGTKVSTAAKALGLRFSFESSAETCESIHSNLISFLK